MNFEFLRLSTTDSTAHWICYFPNRNGTLVSIEWIHLQLARTACNVQAPWTVRDVWVFVRKIHDAVSLSNTCIWPTDGIRRWHSHSTVFPTFCSVFAVVRINWWDERKWQPSVKWRVSRCRKNKRAVIEYDFSKQRKMERIERNGIVRRRKIYRTNDWHHRPQNRMKLCSRRCGGCVRK